MHKRIGIVLLASLVLGSEVLMAATLLKCVGPDGKVIYTNEGGGKGCVPVGDGGITVVPAYKVPARPARTETVPAVSPSPPPKEEPALAPDKPGNSAAANTLSRESVEAALREAEQQLQQAQKALEEQESLRMGGEQNYAKVQERLKPYQERVEQQQRMVESLKKALGQ